MGLRVSRGQGFLRVSVKCSASNAHINELRYGHIDNIWENVTMQYVYGFCFKTYTHSMNVQIKISK